MTVKAYLALLVGVFVVALVAVSLVQRNLVGELDGVVRDVTGSHAGKARAARELRAAHLVERRAVAGFLRNAELELVSRTDALTGPHNRRHLEEQLQRLAGAGGHPAVLLCDIDRFKQVNDIRGHAAGDEVLRVVAGRLREAARPGDVPGRWAARSSWSCSPAPAPRRRPPRASGSGGPSPPPRCRWRSRWR